MPSRDLENARILETLMGNYHINNISIRHKTTMTILYNIHSKYKFQFAFLYNLLKIYSQLKY